MTLEIEYALAQGRLALATLRREEAEREASRRRLVEERDAAAWADLLRCVRQRLGPLLGFPALARAGAGNGLELLAPPIFNPWRPRAFDGRHEWDVALVLADDWAPLVSRWVPDLLGWRQAPLSAAGDWWAVDSVDDLGLPRRLTWPTLPLALASAEEEGWALSDAVSVGLLEGGGA